MTRIIETLKGVSLLDGLVYGFTLWGLLSAWGSLALIATDPLGVSLVAVAIFGTWFAVKTYCAYLAHGRSEKGWMLAVSWVPFTEAYYLYTRKLRRS